MVIIRGERGNRVVDSAVRMAVGVFRVLLVRQSFIWIKDTSVAMILFTGFSSSGLSISIR